ncbi:MAG TPA: RNA methyltransferase, partial [Blastocatellia bacterium]|nr:RNA methyltransferase [Blastocatellia bacterium]
MTNLYGLLPVLEAIRAGGRPIERIIIAQGARHERLRELIEAARRANIPVRREPRALLDRLTGRANHQGVVAIAGPAAYADESELLSKIDPHALFVLLDGVEDPHNLGAIIRTAECAGASAVFIPERRSAHISDVVVKTSAGATEYMPVARVTNLSALIEDLKKRNVWVVGVEAAG